MIIRSDKILRGTRRGRRRSNSDVLPFGRLWYGEPAAIRNAIGYAKFRSRSHDAVIRVYDERGRVQRTVSFAKQIGGFGAPARKRTCPLAVFQRNCLHAAGNRLQDAV
jgi:hypothetical protein